jgi:hypothetical protein
MLLSICLTKIKKNVRIHKLPAQMHHYSASRFILLFKSAELQTLSSLQPAVNRFPDFFAGFWDSLRYFAALKIDDLWNVGKIGSSFIAAIVQQGG